MFQFKQFTVRQEHAAMKVGTDGVLLGAWAELEHADGVLDIGTGTGLIALMAAQRNPHARIDAIEIEPLASRQAQENVNASPWRERIEVYCTALQDFFPGRLYDSIVCNPPFFINSTKTPDSSRTLARHCDTLPHTELVRHTLRLLQPQGVFCVILPTAEANRLVSHARSAGLCPERITHVHPTPAKPPKRVLLQFRREPALLREEHLVIELDRHRYSEEYISLTKAFYLRM